MSYSWHDGKRKLDISGEAKDVRKILLLSFICNELPGLILAIVAWVNISPLSIIPLFRWVKKHL